MAQHQQPFPGGNNDGDGFWPQQPPPLNNEDNSLNSQFEKNSDPHPYKRSKNSNIKTSSPKSTPLPPAVQNDNPSAYIFYKTRVCFKFHKGKCRYEHHCTYAHGRKELREPPPNWQELVKDKRECSVINIQTRRPNMYCKLGGGEADVLNNTSDATQVSMGGETKVGHLLNNSEVAIQVGTVTTDPDALQASVKARYQQTRICSKWEAVRQCKFADRRRFAHGLAELHMPTGRDIGSSIPPNELHIPIAEVPPTASEPVQQDETRGFAKLAHKKLNRIYADWIDDEDE